MTTYITYLIKEALYQEGWYKPRYPMPAIRNNDVYGGVEGDWLLVGCWYLDWSKGNLTIY